MKQRKKRVINKEINWAKEERENMSMFNDYLKGLTVYEVADKYGCSPQWVAKLVTADLSEELKQTHKNNRLELLYKKLKNIA